MNLPAPPSRNPLAERRRAEPEDELPRMGLLDHLDELRRRIVNSLIALVVACGVAWLFIDPIIGFLQQPILPHLDGGRLVFLGPADALMLYIKVALLAGVFLALPVILWQVWRFITPGLYERERRWAAPFVILGTLFFVAGGAFAYYVAFPFAVEFLLEFSDQFESMITVDRYMKFLMTVILGLGVMFELPIVIFLLAQIGLVTPAFLMRHFRWAVVLIFVLAAVITPTPDIVNLCIFAVPTIGLYLLGVAAAWVTTRHRRKREEKEGGESGEAG